MPEATAAPTTLSSPTWSRRSANFGLRLCMVLAWGVMIFLNFANATQLFDGFESNADVSNRHPTAVTPSGWAFAIWGPIFIFLGVWVLFFAVPGMTISFDTSGPNQSWSLHNQKHYIGGHHISNFVGVLFIINTLLNGAWSFAFGAEIFWLAFMVQNFITSSAIAIYAEMAVTTGKRSSFPSLSTTYWCGRFPLSLYLGWLSFAQIAMVSVFLKVELGDSKVVNSLSQEIWAAIMLGVATILGVVMLVRHQDIVFNLVLVWALVSIQSVGKDIQHFTALYLAIFLSFMIVTCTLVSCVRRYRSTPDLLDM